ncbi:serine/threonine-protein phosphatase 7 long form homolog [Brassica rapa]|uniref:serine/threonine-protein phosphatase 7 long form homolog n=1 Tax=Brassica campestris TaxID=3711 RepID=UPI00142D2395|nr:serine/threonine-protein phosphatase 7 long form homolog [Brassica rapa]
MEDLVEEREDLMVSPSTHLLKPCFTTSIEGSPPLDLKALSLSVSFNGWRFPNAKFKSWATKMSALHEPTWKKAGIFEAVVASTLKITKDSDLVLEIAEKWCPDTNTFVFPWGEATITLEDVLLLLGFSVLGSPVFASLDSSGEKTKEKLEKERVVLKRDQVSNRATQTVWMSRFMDSGDDDELEHVAFLALWLSYFVFPTRYYQINEAIFPVAVHLASGVRIGLAPAVLAHLYADLTLLKDHTRDSSNDKIELNALFKLVQVWTWERFRELRPKDTNPLLKGQIRLARWDDVKEGNNDVRQNLDNSSFEWRPFTNTVKNWEFPKFYPEKAIWVRVGPELDEAFISFTRCIKVSELVGMDCVEHYFPNRVAAQFGLLQDVPCLVNMNNLSEEEAWNEYDKPIEDLTLFIPSRFAVPRVTSMFCDWWRKSFPQLQGSVKEKCVGGDYVDVSASGSRKRKLRKRVCTVGCCQTRDSDDDEDLSLTIAQIRRLSIKKCSGGEDASEPLGKKSRFEVDNNDLGNPQDLGSVRAEGNETVPPPEIKQNMVMSPNNSSDPPLGFDDATQDILVSPPLVTRQTCDDELDVHVSNVEKMAMPNDGNKEPECLLHEDGGMAGEKASSERRMMTVNNEQTSCQNLAPGGSESNSGKAVVDETQGHDCLFDDTVLGSEEPMKSSEQLEKRQEDVGGGNDSYEKSLHNVKELASSIEKLGLSIEEGIAKAERNVAWLKVMRTAKQKKIAAATRLI